MTAMTDARRELRETLDEAGFIVEDHVPENVVPPLVSFRATSPMLERDRTLQSGEVIFRMEVLVVAESGSNEDSIASLEEAVENLWLAIEDTDWFVEEVGTPFYATHNGFEYPSVALIINAIITLEGGN